MKDILLTYTDKPTAEATLADWTTTDEDRNVLWSPKPGCDINEIKVVLQEAIIDTTDPDNPVVMQPEEASDTYWLNIAVPDVEDKGYDPAHDQIIADLEVNPGWQATINRPVTPTSAVKCIVRTSLTPEQLSSMQRIDGIPAGGKYIFQGE